MLINSIPAMLFLGIVMKPFYCALQLLARATRALPGNPEARHYYAQWAYLNDRDRICMQQETAALRLPGLNDVALLQMNTLLGMCASRMEAIPEAKAAFVPMANIGSLFPFCDWQHCTMPKYAPRKGGLEFVIIGRPAAGHHNYKMLGIGVDPL